MRNIVFLNGEYTNKPLLSTEDRGFHFGDGLYDIMLINNRQIVDFALHNKRMCDTAEKIHISLDYSKDEIFAVANNLIAQNSITDGMLTIVISRGSSNRMLKEINSIKQNFLIQAENVPCNVGSQTLTTITLKSFEDIRWAWRNIKVTSLLPSVILRHEANKDGFDDVLYHNSGLISETSRANIYIVKNDKIYTPPLSINILPGITRARIIDLLRGSGLEITEQTFSMEDLLDADEVFTTSATKRVLGVSRVDSKIYNKHSVTKKILEIYDKWVIDITK